MNPGENRRTWIYRVITILLLQAITPLAARQIEVRQTLFLPPEYYVGDEVELRIRFLAPDGVNPRSPDSLPESSWLEFSGADIGKIGDEWEARITFVSFRPGTRTLPTIEFGDVVIEGIKSHTSAILETDDPGFVESRGQLYLPGTELILAILIGTVFAGPLAGFGLVGLLRGKFSRILAERRWRRPYRDFQKDFKELYGLSEGIDAKSFYFGLSKTFRTYLTKRTDQNYLTVTTRELVSRIGQILTDRSVLGDLAGILTFGDEVKFGGKRSSKREQQRHMELIGQSVEEVEGVYRHAREIDRRKKG